MFGLFKKKHEVVDAEPAEVSVAEPAPEAPAKEADDEIAKAEAFVAPPGLMHGMDSGIPGFAYSPVDQDEEFRAHGGQPLAEGVAVASEDAVIEAMREVYDPEIPVNIYDLGLIYDLIISDNGDIKIDMSLTAPGCPVAGEMPGMVARAVEAVPGTGEIEVLLVWEPQWTPERMSEDAKLALGMG